MEALLLALFQSAGLLNIDTKNYQTAGSPAEKGDEVLGDLTELEKACKMFLDQNREKHKELHEQIQGLDQDSPSISKIHYQHHLLHTAEEAVNKMMWMSISHRFQQVDEKVKAGSGFAIRNGNKVVLTAPKKEERGDFFSRMMGGRGGITVIEVGMMKF